MYALQLLQNLQKLKFSNLQITKIFEHGIQGYIKKLNISLFRLPGAKRWAWRKSKPTWEFCCKKNKLSLFSKEKKRKYKLGNLLGNYPKSSQSCILTVLIQKVLLSLNQNSQKGRFSSTFQGCYGCIKTLSWFTLFDIEWLAASSKSNNLKSIRQWNGRSNRLIWPGKEEYRIVTSWGYQLLLSQDITCNNFASKPNKLHLLKSRFRDRLTLNRSPQHLMIVWPQVILDWFSTLF